MLNQRHAAPTSVHHRSRLLLPVAVAVVVGTSAVFSSQAEAQTPGLDLSIAIGSCDTAHANPAKCTIALGGQMTVALRLNDISGLPNPDSDGKAGYAGIQMRLTYSAGLTLNQRAALGEVVWPDCVYGGEANPAQTYLAGCAFGAGANESVFTGTVVEVDFTCTAQSSQQSVTLVHGAASGGNPVGDTFLVDESGATELAEAGIETLTINCVTPPVGGVAEVPDAARAPVATRDDSSGPGAGRLAAVSTAALVVVALAATTWLATRRRGAS